MARPHPDLLDLAAGRQPRDGAGNDTLAGSALEHRMGGLLWTWARERHGGGVWCDALARADLVQQAHHRRLWHTLGKVQRRLGELGVEVATAKGVTAELRWYGRLGERPCADLDVLVAPWDHARAGEIVDALHPRHPLTGDIGDLARRGLMQSVNLVVDDVPVDLHFDLLKVGIATRQQRLVWERMQPCTSPDGGSLRAPAPEIALVHALLHLNKDGFRCLLGFVDVARILEREDLDWGFVDRFLRAEGLEVAGYRSLETVTRVLDIPCHPHARPRGLRAAVWSAVWHDGVLLLGEGSTRHRHRQEWIRFVAPGRLPEALRWWVRVLLPPAAAVDAHYDDLAGPYLWKLARGRTRALRQMRGARSPADAEFAAPQDAPLGPVRAKAAVLRRRAVEGPLWLPVRGRSMGWSIRPPSEVLVVGAHRPRRGEVWAFCDDGGGLVVHRYRGAGNGRHVFQGDRRLHRDAPVRSGQLVGRVVAVRRHGRTRRLGAGDRLIGALAGTRRMVVPRIARARHRIRLGTDV